MEMTISDHIEVLKSYHNGFTGYAGNLQESIDVAVDIMEKYQKIQKALAEIENDWQLKKYPSSPFSCGLRRAIEIIDKAETEDT